jgi:hypothetical protein
LDRRNAFADNLSCVSNRLPRWQKQSGWEVFETEGVSPVACGGNGRDSALSYARQRAGYAPTEIRVLDKDWNALKTVLRISRRTSTALLTIPRLYVAHPLVPFSVPFSV